MHLPSPICIIPKTDLATLRTQTFLAQYSVACEIPSGFERVDFKKGSVLQFALSIQGHL